MESKGRAAWFLWHRAILLTAFVLSLTATVLVVAAVETEGLPHMQNLHSRLGMGTTALALLQALGGVARPPKQHRLRALWQRAHRLVGTCTWLLAVTTSIYGAARLPAIDAMYSMVEASDDRSLVLAVAAVAASSVGSFVLLEVFAVSSSQRHSECASRARKL